MTNTNNTNNTTSRKSRKDIPLGNRFADLPTFGEDNAPAFKRDEVLTLTEVALLAGKTKITASKYLANPPAGGDPVHAVVLVPTSSSGIGRPAPAYPRQDVERALGMVDVHAAADAMMAAAAAGSED